jgi:hypothetical protein
MKKIISLAALFVVATLFPALAADTAVAAAPVNYWGAIQDWLLTPAAISGFVGFLTAILPQGTPGTVWGYVRLALDFIGSNWGNAKNVTKA